MTARHPGLHYDQKRQLWVATVDLPRGPGGSRRRLRRTSRDQGTAERLLKEMRAEVAVGVVTATTSPTVGQWMDYWLEHIASQSVAPSTLDNYTSTVRLNIKPSIGHIRLDRLRTADVRRLHAHVYERGPGTATARFAHYVLRTALHKARADRHVRENVAELEAPPSITPTSRTALTVPEARQVLESTATDRLGARWALALLLGLRRGETIGLELDSVLQDRIRVSWQLRRLKMKHGCAAKPSGGQWPCGLKRGGACPQATADIRRAGYEVRQLDGSLHLIRPKTKAGWRLMPLPPGVDELVARRMAVAQEEPNPHGLLFTRDATTGPLTGRPIDPDDDTEAWLTVAERAGITRPVTLHETRHTTATLLQANGVDESTRIQLIGHSSITTTRNYEHVVLDLRRDALSKVAQTLGVSGGDPSPPSTIEMSTPSSDPVAPDPDLIAITKGWHGDITATSTALKQFGDMGVQTVVVLGGLGALRPGRHGRAFDQTLAELTEQNDVNIVLIDGPGDPLPRLLKLPEGPDGWRQIVPRVQWAPRGHTWTWMGQKFAALGGGHGRGGIPGMNRWPDHEALTEADLAALPDGPVDVLMTATAPDDQSDSASLVTRAAHRLTPGRVIHTGSVSDGTLLWDMAADTPVHVYTERPRKTGTAHLTNPAV